MVGSAEYKNFYRTGPKQRKKKMPSKKKVRGKGTEGRQGREGREKEGGGCDMPQGNRSKSG